MRSKKVPSSYTSSRRRWRVSIAACAVSVTAVLAAHAVARADSNWANDPNNADWGNPASWENGIVPGVNDLATFYPINANVDPNPFPHNRPNVSDNQAVNGLRIFDRNSNYQAFGWTITGTGNLSIGAAGIQQVSTTMYTDTNLNANLTLTADQAWYGEDANYGFGRLNINGVVSGTGAVTYSGVINLNVSAQNTFSGGFTANNASGGALGLLASSTTDGNGNVLSGPLGTGPVTVTSGWVEGNGHTLDNPVTVNGVASIHNLTLSQTPLINGGVLQYANNQTDPAFNLGSLGGGIGATNNALVIVTSATTLSFANGGARAFTLGGDSTQPNSFAAAITDSGANVGSLTKIGAGTWQINATQAYSGPTVSNGGTLLFGTSSAVSPNSTYVVNANSGLAFAAGVTSPVFGGLAGNGNINLVTAGSETVALAVGGNNQDTTYGGTLSGGNGFTKQGTGTLLLFAAQNYGGATAISGGTLQLAGGNTAAGLAHRWSFNGNYSDSVGGVTAVGFGNATIANGQVTIAGEGSSHVNYVSLGDGSTNILPATNSPATIELWATENQVQSWSRVFDFGNTNGGAGNLLWSWTQSTWDPSVISVNGPNYNAAKFAVGREYHVALVLKPDGENTDLNWYQMDGSGNLLNSGSITASGWDLSKLPQTNMWLGRSEWPDNDANASYDEVRIWNTALSQVQLSALSVLGPDAQLGVITNLLPTTTTVTISAGAALDLGGANQKVVSLAGSGSITNSNAGNSSVLTASSSDSSTNTTFGGSIQDGAGGVRLVLSGSGTLVLAGINTYTGGTDVMGGTLVLANPAAIEDGTSLTVGAGADTIFGASGSATAVASVAVLPVPEPSTLALMLAAAWFGVMHRRVRRRSKAV